MSVPLIAIVGRANVGKSTLFNRLTRTRNAIVNDTPGVTRDRIYGRTEWLGKPILVVDTGGIDIDGRGEIEAQVIEQGRFARDEADAVILVVDNHQGLTPQDREVVDQLRKCSKSLFLAVNKVDDVRHEAAAYDFSALGLEKIYPISAEHGHGIAELLEDVASGLPEAEDEPTEDTVRLAIVGKPNVGKSSLVNCLLNSDRCIVSEVPGTTRDAIDSHLVYNDHNFLIVDTAGIRRKGRTRKLLDKYAVIMALKALDRCDIAVLVLDATAGVTEQDATIAGYAIERGRGCIIAVNKCDLAKRGDRSLEEIREEVKNKLKFLDFAPIMTISAKTGEGVPELLPQVETVSREYSRSISTGRLNECFEQAIRKNPMSSFRGKFMKLYYSTQVKSRPPTFKCFVNYPQGIHFSYQRYLINYLRGTFGFSGTPVRLIFAGKQERD